MAVDIMTLAPGATIRRKGDGVLLLVTGNPRDGMWLHVRPVEKPAAEEELCFVEEIAEVVRTGTTAES